MIFKRRGKDNVKQIVPDISKFEIDDVVSILIGSTPDSETHIEYKEDSSEGVMIFSPLRLKCSSEFGLLLRV